MPDVITSTYKFTLPEVGGSDETWGTKLNANWQTLENRLAGSFVDAPADPTQGLGFLKSSSIPTRLDGDKTINGSVELLKQADNLSLILPLKGATDGQDDVNAPEARFLSDLVGAHADAPYGLRLRMSGQNATGGLFQLTSADAGYMSFNPRDGKIIAKSSDAGTSGIGFDSIWFEATTEEPPLLQSSTAGRINFQAPNTGAGSYDVNVMGAADDSSHSIRLFRRTGGVNNFLGSFLLLEPDSTIARVRLDTTGLVDAVYANIGNYWIGALNDGTVNADYISTISGETLNFRSGVTSGSAQGAIRGSDNVVTITFGSTATVPGGSTWALTRAMGDGRYTLSSSSARYKEEIGYAARVPGFMDLRPAFFRWGKGLVEDDPRIGKHGYGLLAEDVYQVFPAAVRLNEEGQPDGLDALSLIGALHAEVAALQSRIAKLEGVN